MFLPCKISGFHGD